MSTTPTCPQCGSQTHTYKEGGTRSKPDYWYTKCLKDCLETGSCQTGEGSQAEFVSLTKSFRATTTPQTVDFDTYKTMVKVAVQEKLGSRPWYRGCCTDTVQGSYNSGASVEQAATTAASDTCYWDGGAS